MALRCRERAPSTTSKAPRAVGARARPMSGVRPTAAAVAARRERPAAGPDQPGHHGALPPGDAQALLRRRQVRHLSRSARRQVSAADQVGWAKARTRSLSTLPTSTRLCPRVTRRSRRAARPTRGQNRRRPERHVEVTAGDFAHPPSRSAASSPGTRSTPRPPPARRRRCRRRTACLQAYGRHP